MNKCEWKDGKLGRCSELDFSIRRRDALTFYHDTGKLYFTESGIRDQLFEFCPFCGANIQKPKPTDLELANEYYEATDENGQIHRSVKAAFIAGRKSVKELL